MKYNIESKKTIRNILARNQIPPQKKENGRNRRQGECNDTSNTSQRITERNIDMH